MSDAPARPIHALMSGLIDYAGLFPPAGLAMPDAVANYARFLRAPDSWMLGRFILPVSRLEEFRKAAAGGGHLPRDADTDPWPLSALIDGDLDADLDAVFAFNAEHAPGRAAKNGAAIIDAIEIKVPDTSNGGPSVAFIDAALDGLPDGLYPFFELPVLATGAVPPDLRGCIAALAGEDAAAKIRTGGVKPDAIPPTRAVADFIAACAAGDVPFKATAGLHHAVRAEHPLTYDPAGPRAVMHGFVNVFFAAAIALNMRADADQLAAILTESDPRAFEFHEHELRWRALHLDTSQLVRAREQFALSFGSCSFEEPVEEIPKVS